MNQISSIENKLNAHVNTVRPSSKTQDEIKLAYQILSLSYF